MLAWGTGSAPSGPGAHGRRAAGSARPPRARARPADNRPCAGPGPWVLGLGLRGAARRTRTCCRVSPHPPASPPPEAPWADRQQSGGGGGRLPPRDHTQLEADAPPAAAALACRRWAYCSRTSGSEAATFRSISSNFFRLPLDSERMISRLILQGRAGSGDSRTEGPSPCAPRPPEARRSSGPGSVGGRAGRWPQQVLGLQAGARGPATAVGTELDSPLLPELPLQAVGPHRGAPLPGPRRDRGGGRDGAAQGEGSLWRGFVSLAPV